MSGVSVRRVGFALMLLIGYALVLIGRITNAEKTDKGAYLPELKVPEGMQLWQLGFKSNWPHLEKALEPFSFGKFWVVDPETEEHLAKIRKRFDESRSEYGHDVVHILADRYGGDSGGLARQLVALGVNPDQPTVLNYRPSHLCSIFGRLEVAKVLRLCRPDLSATNSRGHTPLESAQDSEKEQPAADEDCIPGLELRATPTKVSTIWEEVMENGYPSIAELAYKKEWAPLQNLCRRRVPSVEAQSKFEGKTAIEWALEYDEFLLAAELGYLLDEPSIFPDNM